MFHQTAALQNKTKKYCKKYLILFLYNLGKCRKKFKYRFKALFLYFKMHNQKLLYDFFYRI